jgi:chaperonin GroES
MKTIKPLNQQVFAKPVEAETKTASGILLTEKTADKPKTAAVINVGPQVKDVKANDIIVYKTYTTTDVKVNDEDYIMLAEEDILGVEVVTGE